MRNKPLKGIYNKPLQSKDDARDPLASLDPKVIENYENIGISREILTEMKLQRGDTITSNVPWNRPGDKYANISRLQASSTLATEKAADDYWKKNPEGTPGYVPINISAKSNAGLVFPYTNPPEKKLRKGENTFYLDNKNRLRDAYPGTITITK